MFKDSVFSYCQLKGNSVNSENSNRFKKNTAIQEQNCKAHSIVVLKITFCLKGNKIFQVHYTLLKSDILKARNKPFVCSHFNLRRKIVQLHSEEVSYTLVMCINEDPFSFL